MRSGVVTFLLVIFSLHAFYQAGVVIWFHANRAYIASVLCENKSKPELKCKGNCQLNKKAKNNSDKDDRNLPASVNKWVEISPCEIVSTPALFNLHEARGKYYSAHPGFYAFKPNHAIFHPPTS